MGKEFASYVASDPARSGKRPGIIVLPEWWGLNDYLRRRARELAGLGFVGDGNRRVRVTDAKPLIRPKRVS